MERLAGLGSRFARRRASGRGIHAQGDAGDDRLELHGEPGDLRIGRGDFALVGRGGDGDEEILVSGGGALVLGDAGDDHISASGANMVINGGEGADTIDVAGLTDSEIVLGRGDVVTGRGLAARQHPPGRGRHRGRPFQQCLGL